MVPKVVQRDSNIYQFCVPEPRSLRWHDL